MENLQIKPGAVFISDAHDNANKRNFLKFLRNLGSAKTLPPQIFMLGDMFDFLANTTFVCEFYAEYIEAINEISQKCEIYYFEGNHDFNLEAIFPHARVFANCAQPANFSFKGEKIQISHGDIFLPALTKFALLSLRNRAFLKFMDKIDCALNFKISKMILKSQENKILYKKAENFKSYIEPKIHNYTAPIVIEGHYHQDEILEFEGVKYINLNSFAVSEKIYEVQNSQNFELFSKNLN